MRSPILSIAAVYLLPLLLIFSVFVLLRGHDEPGGRFIGGLVAAAAFTLYSLAFSVRQALRVLRVSPRLLIALGLILAVISGLIGLALGKPFMTAIWNLDLVLPAIGKLSTVLLFDTGVYFVVLGVVLTIVFTFFEDEAF